MMCFHVMVRKREMIRTALRGSEVTDKTLLWKGKSAAVSSCSRKTPSVMIEVWDSVDFPIPLFSDLKVTASRLAFCVGFVSSRNGVVLAGDQSKGSCSLFPFPSIQEDVLPWAGLCCCGFPTPSRLLRSL